jgi:nucleoid-associated protein YgaU
MRRYTDSTVYDLGRARGSSNSPLRIRDAVEAGTLTCEERVIQQGERLDGIAGEVYGNSTLWWAIAAASGIGWALQVPPGTRILIPSINQLKRII